MHDLSDSIYGQKNLSFSNMMPYMEIYTFFGYHTHIGFKKKQKLFFGEWEVSYKMLIEKINCP